MYKYEEIKPVIFTEDGQVKFLRIRDNVSALIAKAGAFRMAEAIQGVCGDTWIQLACVDRLVELGEIREISPEGVATQHRVFVKS